MKLLHIIKSIIKEDITFSRSIVYHRTKQNVSGKLLGVNRQNVSGKTVDAIASGGYIVGVGGKYGAGVYATYSLESQFIPRMKEMYGDIIIESKILSMDKFLIFDYDIAKRLYGNKNYTLDKQLQLILGNEWSKYKNDLELKELISSLSTVEFSGSVALDFYRKYKGSIVRKLRGMVLRDPDEGDTIVSYDRKNIEPIRYTENEGKTWKNLLNKNIYNRVKSYDKNKVDLQYQHILNKLEADFELSDAEKKHIIRNIDNFLDIIIKYNEDTNVAEDLFKSADKDEIVVIIDAILSSSKMMDNMNKDLFYALLSYSSKVGEAKLGQVIDALIFSDYVLNNLSTIHAETLFKYAARVSDEKSEQILDKIFSLDNFIIKADKKTFDNLHRLYKSKNKKFDYFIQELLLSDKFIDNAKVETIIALLGDSLSLSEDKLLIIINNLLSSDVFMDKIGGDFFKYLRRNIDNIGHYRLEQYLDILLSSDYFVKNMTKNNVKNLLLFSRDLDNSVRMFRAAKPDFFNKTKNFLLSKGVSQNIIDNYLTI